MEEKYYTPEISEFHVGFEYERKNGEIWEKDAIMMNDDFYSSGDEYENEFEEIDKGIRDVRVKFLDKEDIESLGGIVGVRCIEGNGENVYKIGDCFIRLHCDYGKTTKIWYKYPDNLVFNGIIKNISAFKQVLKMVGVE